MCGAGFAAGAGWVGNEVAGPIYDAGDDVIEAGGDVVDFVNPF